MTLSQGERVILMQLEEYMQYRETTPHTQPGFPYNTYLCTIPLDFQHVGLHWHDQMELVYIKKGQGTVTVNLIPYPVSAGYIVPILPGELHSIDGDPSGPMEYENIIFSLTLLDTPDENEWCHTHIIEALRRGTLTFPRPICPGTVFHASVSGALDTADAACEKMESGYSLIVKSQLFLMLHALYTFREEAVPSKHSRHAKVLKPVFTWVKAHFQDSISVAEAAKITGYSPAHFMRIFRQETGQTFLQFLNDYRLSAAGYYLKETDDPVGKIASECGFDNFSYFIRSFRRKYGVSPRQYRAGLRSD